ncbi:Protein ANTAGONIST OF LIKE HETEROCHROMATIN PROTEIN 1 [Frankliniella fusca]|uniref:Protein ANTAGONIST OF LIKE HETEROCHROMATIN PROTEIN 1 n=1 Tax=Frankliniella fusca TaxID=407009 RepID=A0AAE1HMN4_9NEOP|nr:Protein ANTAGONIST OF LIKE HETEROCHROMATIN PROTEIN 1 [Frankliniella fusca]
MSRVMFEELCGVVFNHVVEKNRVIRKRRPFQDIMLMVVWLMATPDCFRSVGLRFGVTPSTLYYVYSYVILAVDRVQPLCSSQSLKSCSELAATQIIWSDAVERTHISQTFERATHFPGVICCIYCTHINITAKLEDARQCINRHHSYSINVQAVVDHNLLARHLHVGEVGSMNEKRVFTRSPLHHDLLHLPPGLVIGPDEHLVGDSAYVVTSFEMMAPYPNNCHLTERQLNFNKKLSQCRVRVENAFARAKGKWRRLKFLHVRNPRNLVEHVTASFVLHNFLIREGEQMEAELASPINDNEMLAGVIDEQLIDDVPEAERVLQDAAEARGDKNRLFYSDHLLPLPEEEEREE